MFQDMLTSEPIIINEGEHRYYYGYGQDKIEFMSQSKVIESLQIPFDEVYQSEKCSKNPRHEFFRVAPAEIRGIWREKNLRSREYGSDLHYYIEDDLTGAGLRAPKHDITQIKAAYLDFKDKILSKLEFLHAENIICHPDYHVAGTYDYMGIYDNKLFMLDWKTNSKFNVLDGFKFKEPYAFLENSKWTLYSLQAAIYKFIIEDHYKLSLPESRIVWFKADMTEAEYRKVANVATAWGKDWVVIKPRDFEKDFGKNFIKNILNHAIRKGC